MIQQELYATEFWLDKKITFFKNITSATGQTRLSKQKLTIMMNTQNTVTLTWLEAASMTWDSKFTAQSQSKDGASSGDLSLPH